MKLGRLFPYDAMFQWLSYGNDPNSEQSGNDKDYFSHREWSFTIEDDIYIRYQSFRDQQEMTQAIQKRQPHKIDLGAVFTACPKDHTTIKPELFKTVERELVFDIDMTDYDDIRTCCTGAEICMRCWPYMTMAVKVVDRALREDFAFRNILWVYSGRRGVHCWVCDPEARKLTNEARAAVVEYLSIHSGTAENSDKKLKSSFVNPHPMMRRAYDVLDPYFERCIADEKGQGLLGRKDRYMKVLNSLPNESIRTELYERWEKQTSLTGADRWRQMREATTTPTSDQLLQQGRKKRINYQEVEMWRHELVFQHCYPRLDANVSKTQNHLLKSPFCVHPKTGRVCVPIDVDHADTFSPFDVPTVRSLCQEVDDYDLKHSKKADDGDRDQISDLQKTSMKACMELFNRCFFREMQSVNRYVYYSLLSLHNLLNRLTNVWLSCLCDNRKQQRDRADQAAAMHVDF